MRVSPPTFLAFCAGVLLLSTGSAQALVGVEQTGRISATLVDCHPAADTAGRYATFAAQMSGIPGTEQMSIRFELDERTAADADFHQVSDVPGFGVWKSSAPGVGIFGYSQEVSSLAAEASFRVTVAYRWMGPHHRVFRRARRLTPACVAAGAPSSLVVGARSTELSLHFLGP